MMNIQNTQNSVTRDMMEMAAEAVIDAHRFGTPRRSDSLVKRVLARYEAVTAILPTADEMTEQGGDIVAIANALTSGLVVSAFGKAIRNGLDLGAFSDAVKNGLDVKAFSKAVNSGLRVRHFGSLVRDNSM